MLTATTQITMTVNGEETFIIRNSPETGNYWIVPIKVNRNNLIQGQLALAEASGKMLIHKVEMDSERVLKSTKPFDKV